MIIELIIGGIFGFMVATAIKENTKPEIQTTYYFIEKDKKFKSIIKIESNEQSL